MQLFATIRPEMILNPDENVFADVVRQRDMNAPGANP